VKKASSFRARSTTPSNPRSPSPTSLPRKKAPDDAAAGAGLRLLSVGRRSDLSSLRYGSPSLGRGWIFRPVELIFRVNSSRQFHRGGGITGFNSSYFNLNTGSNNGTGGFANGLNGGSFSLAQSGNDLNLVFTAAGGPGPSPVPEPGTWAAAALLAGGAAFMRWRKRKQVS
jgi:hypothetical protein